MANAIEQEYLSSLSDLTVNSKPLINMLTVLAEENLPNAPVIVRAVEKHLSTTEHRLPVLYLIDSIVKNIGRHYIDLFMQNIVSTFAGVFVKVDEKTRLSMWRLRHTWAPVFSSRKLHAIDLRVHSIDPAWPVQPLASSSSTSDAAVTPSALKPSPLTNSIHINPKIFKKDSSVDVVGGAASTTTTTNASASASASDPMAEILVAKIELLSLQIQTVELALMQSGISNSDKMTKTRELLELRTQKAKLELQQATDRLKNKTSAPVGAITQTSISSSFVQAAVSSTVTAPFTAEPSSVEQRYIVPAAASSRVARLPSSASALRLPPRAKPASSLIRPISGAVGSSPADPRLAAARQTPASNLQQPNSSPTDQLAAALSSSDPRLRVGDPRRASSAARAATIGSHSSTLPTTSSSSIATTAAASSRQLGGKRSGASSEVRPTPPPPPMIRYKMRQSAAKTATAAGKTGSTDKENAAKDKRTSSSSTLSTQSAARRAHSPTARSSSGSTRTTSSSVVHGKLSSSTDRHGGLTQEEVGVSSRVGRSHDKDEQQDQDHRLPAVSTARTNSATSVTVTASCKDVDLRIRPTFVGTGITNGSQSSVITATRDVDHRTSSTRDVDHRTNLGAIGQMFARQTEGARSSPSSEHECASATLSASSSQPTSSPSRCNVARQSASPPADDVFRRPGKRKHQSVAGSSGDVAPNISVAMSLDKDERLPQDARLSTANSSSASSGGNRDHSTTSPDNDDGVRNSSMEPFQRSSPKRKRTSSPKQSSKSSSRKSSLSKGSAASKQTSKSDGSSRSRNHSASPKSKSSSSKDRNNSTKSDRSPPSNSSAVDGSPDAAGQDMSSAVSVSESHSPRDKSPSSPVLFRRAKRPLHTRNYKMHQPPTDLDDENISPPSTSPPSPLSLPSPPSSPPHAASMHSDTDLRLQLGSSAAAVIAYSDNNTDSLTVSADDNSECVSAEQDADGTKSTGDVDLRPPARLGVMTGSKRPLPTPLNSSNSSYSTTTTTTSSAAVAESADQPPAAKKADLEDLFGAEDTDLRFAESCAARSSCSITSVTSSATTTGEAAVQRADSAGSLSAGWHRLKQQRPEQYQSPLRHRAVSGQQGLRATSSCSSATVDGDVDMRQPCHGAQSPVGGDLSAPQPHCSPGSATTTTSTSAVDLDEELRQLEEASELTHKNINMILTQAEEQVRSGEITWDQHNKILTQVVRLDEQQKIRERRTMERRESMEAGGVYDHTRPDTRPDTRPASHHSALPRDSHFQQPQQQPWTDGSMTSSTAGGAGGGRWCRDTASSMSAGGGGGGGGGMSQHTHAAGQPLMQPPHAHRLPSYPSSGEARMFRGGGGAGGSFAPPPSVRPRRMMMRPTTAGAGGGGSDRLLEPSMFRGVGGGVIVRMRHAYPSHPTVVGGGGVDELPEASAELLAAVERDCVDRASTFINDRPSDVLWFGENCVCLLDWDEPRSLYFKPGRRAVHIDGYSVVCRFNDGYTELLVDGIPHSVRLGAPTREVFVDGHGYQVYFGAEPVPVMIEGRQRMLSIDGPPPGVEIGRRRRTDLLYGRIKLVIDGRELVDVYLHGRWQKFVVDGKPHALRFKHGFEAMELNGVTKRAEFGSGLPVSLVVRGRRHYVRFSRLPDGLTPGRGVQVLGMLPDRSPWPCPWQDGELARLEQLARPTAQQKPQYHAAASAAASASVSQPAHAVDERSSIQPSAVSRPAGGSYTADNPGVALAPGARGLDLNDLLSRLVQTGLISTPASTSVGQSGGAATTAATANSTSTASGGGAGGGASNSASRTQQDISNICEIKFKTDSAKIRQPGLISLLYTGIQCSSCGLRFLPEQTVQYSNHLDWHFRENRRELGAASASNGRRWYYDLDTWLNYAEIQDPDDKGEPQFVTSDGAADGDVTRDATSSAVGADAQDLSMCSAAAGSSDDDNQCQVCHETLNKFFHEDYEEWHLANCIRVEGKAYHPSCFEDHKTSLLLGSLEADEKEASSADVSMTDIGSSSAVTAATLNKTEESAVKQDASDSPAHSPSHSLQPENQEPFPPPPRPDTKADPEQRAASPDIVFVAVKQPTPERHHPVITVDSDDDDEGDGGQKAVAALVVKNEEEIDSKPNFKSEDQQTASSPVQNAPSDVESSSSAVVQNSEDASVDKICSDAVEPSSENIDAGVSSGAIGDNSDVVDTAPQHTDGQEDRAEEPSNTEQLAENFPPVHVEDPTNQNEEEVATLSADVVNDVVCDVRSAEDVAECDGGSPKSVGTSQDLTADGEQSAIGLQEASGDGHIECSSSVRDERVVDGDAEGDEVMDTVAPGSDVVAETNAELAMKDAEIPMDVDVGVVASNAADVGRVSPVIDSVCQPLEADLDHQVPCLPVDFSPQQEEDEQVGQNQTMPVEASLQDRQETSQEDQDPQQHDTHQQLLDERMETEREEQQSHTTQHILEANQQVSSIDGESLSAQLAQPEMGDTTRSDIRQQTQQPEISETIQPEIIDKTQPELGDKTQPEINDKTQHEIINKTQHEIINKTQHKMADKTQPEIIDKTKHEISDKTQSETNDKTQSETSDKTQSETSDKTQSETSAKTQPEINKQTQSKISETTQSEISAKSQPTSIKKSQPIVDENTQSQHRSELVAKSGDVRGDVAAKSADSSVLDDELMPASSQPRSLRLPTAKIRLNLAGGTGGSGSQQSAKTDVQQFSERPCAASVKPALIGQPIEEQPPRKAGVEESAFCVIM